MLRKRKSKIIAPAVMLFTEQKNKMGKKQLCVYAQCTYGGVQEGPIWGHTAVAVRKCLTLLSKKCDCGRPYHKHKFTEGVPLRKSSQD